MLGDSEKWRVLHGDCLEVMRGMPDSSVDAVVTDPPYAEIDRDYGRLSEQDWFSLMRPCVAEVTRILKPTGSAVYILQPNFEVHGRMRTWLYRFALEIAESVGIVQDAYWWNYSPFPTSCATQSGLMRQSVKWCVWAGSPQCFRNQKSVMGMPSVAQSESRGQKNSDRMIYRPSGAHLRESTMSDSHIRNGGVTPMNLLPVSNGDSATSAGAAGHGAGTPLPLCSYWVKYICPPGGIVLDPFAGSGTTGVACALEGIRFVGIEKDESYAAIAQKRIAAAYAQGKLNFDE